MATSKTPINGLLLVLALTAALLVGESAARQYVLLRGPVYVLEDDVVTAPSKA